MNELQKEILISYLKRDDIEFLGITFLKGGNVSQDELTIHYYGKVADEWHLITDIVNPRGEISSRSVKASRR